VHAKTVVVDGLWGAVGSMNADNRSLSFNEETVLMMLDADLGAWRMGAGEGIRHPSRMARALSERHLPCNAHRHPFMRSALLLLIAAVLAACAGHAPEAPAPARSSTAPRAIAVYRAIAESIYVRSTGRVVAVATMSLDSACTQPQCPGLARRWGVEELWWARGDSTEARDARTDLLACGAAPLDIHAVPLGRPMLLEADPGDVPPPDADAEEWSRFRAAHAEAAGAVRMSPVGFSRTGRTAVAFVDWRCGPTCGHTVGVALTATSDTSWAIADMLLVTSRQRR
jgi:hypothetical protein